MPFGSISSLRLEFLSSEVSVDSDINYMPAVKFPVAPRSRTDSADFEMPILRQIPGDTLLFRTDCPRECRRSSGSARPESTAEEKKEAKAIEPIFCGNCGGVVTAKDQKIGVQGSHRHTFFNPAGIVYELGCFKDAPGCYSAGELTSHFSWFAGYRWRFALCRHCNSHLGWRFQGGENPFFGLILKDLRE